MPKALKTCPKCKKSGHTDHNNECKESIKLQWNSLIKCLTHMIILYSIIILLLHDCYDNGITLSQWYRYYNVAMI